MVDFRLDDANPRNTCTKSGDLFSGIARFHEERSVFPMARHSWSDSCKNFYTKKKNIQWRRGDTIVFGEYRERRVITSFLSCMCAWKLGNNNEQWGCCIVTHLLLES